METMYDNFFTNDGCAIVYSISRISLLDMKLIFEPLFQFENAFSDIWIFLTPKGDGGRHLLFL